VFCYNGDDSDPFRFAEALDLADTIEFNPAGSKCRIGTEKRFDLIGAALAGELAGLPVS